MRRTYISPEFDYSRVYGTFNMKEEASFFGSKMLQIEDNVLIDSQSLVYFQSLNNEQINLSVESLLPPTSYSASDDKRVNSKLIIDPSQTSSQKNTNTQYILTINLKSILTDYIFASLKKWRTFEGIKNNMTKNGDINYAITEYIVKNVLDRYKLASVDLYLKYVDITNQSALRYDNVWAGYTDPITNRISALPEDVGTDKYRLSKFQQQTQADYSSTIITFSQQQNSEQYCFDYFFKLSYQKI